MYNYTIKTRFFSHEMPKALSNKTGFNFLLYNIIFVENWIQYDAIYNFSVWLKTDSNPADINRFQSYT